MPKEKNYNPVQAQRKADKAKALKKGKTNSEDRIDLLIGIIGKHERQERLNEKLSRKNPERIQKQIDDLKKITSSGGKLTRHEEQTLEGLEKEIKAVKKAREALGDKAPTFSRGWNRDHDSGSRVLGKRRRGSNDATTSDEEVPDDVKSIPMPRDTPPPIPKDVMDKWYAERRARREAENPRPDAEDKQKREAPVVEAKTVYEAKPVVRDLRKEAVSAFVPTAVKMKMNKGQGQGGLIEPEEADRLEQEGYLKTADRSSEARPDQGQSSRHVTMEDVEDEEA
jgi:archaellum component FlaC